MSDPFATYRALPGVNASLLKWAAVSPRHYAYYRDHDRPDTAAMSRGRAIHTAVLEPDELPRRYTVWPQPRKGKEWTEFATGAELAGLEVLTQDEYTDALATRDAVRNHPVASGYLRKGFAEETVSWTDEATGLACKARPDFVCTDAATIVDLKTARDIGERVFGRQMHDLLYHVQAAHYVAALNAVTALDWDFVFAAVESGQPHDVRCGHISPDALWAGEQERRRLLNLVKECTDSGVWPGAYEEESEFDLPLWYYAQGERELEGLA